MEQEKRFRETTRALGGEIGRLNGVGAISECGSAIETDVVKTERGQLKEAVGSWNWAPFQSNS